MDFKHKMGHKHQSENEKCKIYLLQNMQL